MRRLIQNIGVWGDSLLKGVVLDEMRGKYETLKNSVAAQCAKILGLDIANNSRFGSTVTKGCRSLTQALEKGLDCDAVVIEFGGNDCDFNWEEVSDAPDAPHQPRTPLDTFRQTYRDMIQAVRQRDIEPVLMSLPPLDAQRYFDWITRTGLSRDNIMRFLGDVGRIYRHHESYSLAVTNMAMEQKCHYIGVREAFLTQPAPGDLMCADGIHPNGRGHVVMQEAFVGYMRSLA